jgi:hypothetical protein
MEWKGLQEDTQLDFDMQHALHRGKLIGTLNFQLANATLPLLYFDY